MTGKARKNGPFGCEGVDVIPRLDSDFLMQRPRAVRIRQTHMEWSSGVYAALAGTFT